MSSHLQEMLDMSLPKSLSGPRKAEGCTQVSLAKASEMHGQRIKCYAIDSTQLSEHALNKLVKTLSATTDDVLFDDAKPGSDDGLRLQFEAIKLFDANKRGLAREVLQSLGLKHRAWPLVMQSELLAAKAKKRENAWR